ncbi:MAG: ABC transporter substrate-binding protein [bacterium]|nr:ABC transporter substrate-binding protein [bacterium]
MTNHTLMRSLLLPAVLAAFALLATACASDDDGAPEPPAPAPAPAPATQAEAAPESPPPAAEPGTTPEPEPAPPPPAEPEAPPEPPPAPPPETAPAEATGEPILVGNISSLTGGALFPEASAAAKAVFDRVNAAGGIGGRPIELIIEDDGGTPEGAATAARKLVEQDDVVAMVGSASTLECVVNAGLYAEAGVYSIQGTGVDPLCFLSPNISPVNTGPYAGITVSLYYASETLGFENICNVNLFVVPDLAPAFDAAVARWEELTGKSLAFRIAAATLQDDPTPLMLQARDAGCQAVVIDGVEPHALAVGRAIEAQGLQDITWIGLTSYYTDAIASQLGSAGNGLQANSEFEPYGSTSPVLDDWRQLMIDSDIALTSFAQGGYLAATIFVDVLGGVDGEITRESVAAALLALDRYDTPLLGTPYSFGDAAIHAPNQASKFVVLQDGAWVTALDEWVVLPN